MVRRVARTLCYSHYTRRWLYNPQYAFASIHAHPSPHTVIHSHTENDRQRSTRTWCIPYDVVMVDLSRFRLVLPVDSSYFVVANSTHTHTAARCGFTLGLFAHVAGSLPAYTMYSGPGGRTTLAGWTGLCPAASEHQPCPACTAASQTPAAMSTSHAACMCASRHRETDGERRRERERESGRVSRRAHKARLLGWSGVGWGGGDAVT